MKLRKTLLLTVVMTVAATAAALLFAVNSPSANAADPMPPVDPTSDPLAAFQYQLDCGPMGQGYFTEISNIGSESEIVEHRVVDEHGIEIYQKIPGRLTYNNITLKRGITSDMYMWTWRKMVEDGDYENAKAMCTINMIDQTGTPVAQWDLTNAWPAAITTPKPEADGTMGLEEITLVCENYQRLN